MVWEMATEINDDRPTVLPESAKTSVVPSCRKILGGWLLPLPLQVRLKSDCRKQPDSMPKGYWMLTLPHLSVQFGCVEFELEWRFRDAPGPVICSNPKMITMRVT